MAGSELFGKEELDSVKKLFNSKNIVLYRYAAKNSMVAEFENLFAEYMGVKYAHAVSSGTAAIHSALAGVGIGLGDEVITTSFTFIAPLEAIAALGATPVPVNIDETYNLDPIQIEKSITEKTKAVVCVPMWSAPKMEEIIKICEKNNLILIEDAAQSLGGKYNGNFLGTFGRVGSFSFDAGKTISTGEGGMVITNDKETYDRVAEFSDHGHMHMPNIPRGKDPRRMPGLNYRMSEVSAAIGLAQLEKIDDVINTVNKIKLKLKNKLELIPGIKFRSFTDEKGSVEHVMILKLKNPGIASYCDKCLTENGLSSSILPEAVDWHFVTSWSHLLKKFDRFDNVDLSKAFNKTDNLLKSSLGLFISLKMDNKKINKIVRVIKQAHIDYSSL